jgi:hypothetical protein
MSTFKIADIRARAKRELTFQKSAATILKEDVAAQKTTRTYDIFLSHSFRDAEIILGVKLTLEDFSYSVYVDWIEDPKLNRSEVSKETAKILRKRMDCCKGLFYSTTESSAGSKWMPWECGYMDGKKGKSAILPLTNTGLNLFRGQEYLGVYPYIQRAKSISGVTKLWVYDDINTYCTLDGWFSGLNPKRQQ